MNRFPGRSLFLLAALLACVAPVGAQPSSPHVGYVFPAGGRPGSTFQVKLGGQYLNGAAVLKVSGNGVSGKILGHTRPPTQKEINDLRERLQELQKKSPKTAQDTAEIADIRARLARAAIRPTPVLAETVTAEITIAADAAPGPRELRLGATTGMSNPLVFDVGRLPEVRRDKELIDPEAPTRRALARFLEPRKKPDDPEVSVTLPAVFNSQIMPGEVDRYRFPARAGQQLVFIARARALIPYLADAVPGWFQATLTLYDADGNEVAYNDDFRDQPDPVLAYQVPRDGDYVLEVRDALYRGREDFVYRVEAGELPFVTSIFPLGGRAFTPVTVALEGWNLPQSSLSLSARDLQPGVRSLSVGAGSLASHRVPFAVDTLPESPETEPNNAAATAQEIQLPVIVNGRLDTPGDREVFRIEGLARQTIVAEVQARRLGSPLDAVLQLTDASGKVLAYNDDGEDRGQGLQTHHADAQLRVTLPDRGTYYLHLRDAQGHGSSAHAYRLRVSGPRPDFELRVTPCSINARPGSTVAITVHALRKDGFAQDIDLSLKYSPVDFSLAGARVPANQNEVRLTLQVPATAREKPVQLAVEGRAVILGQRVTRLAVPAEDMMQAFAYHHLVPAQDMLVTVSGNARARFPARLLERGPVKVRPGGTALVRFAIPRGPSAGKIELVLSEPPEGITLEKAVVTADGAILQIQADAEKVKPGLRANLIVEAYPEAAKKPGGGKAARSPLGTLPAVPFEVLRPNR